MSHPAPARKMKVGLALSGTEKLMSWEVALPVALLAAVALLWGFLVLRGGAGG
jgi:hypothetical protein